MNAYGGAVDLAPLAEKKNICTVENGCGYELRADITPHSTLEECVRTAMAMADFYAADVDKLMPIAEQTAGLMQRVQELTRQVATLISANQRFQDQLAQAEKGAPREAEAPKDRVYVLAERLGDIRLELDNSHGNDEAAKHAAIELFKAADQVHEEAYRLHDLAKREGRSTQAIDSLIVQARNLRRDIGMQKFGLSEGMVGKISSQAHGGHNAEEATG